jgi:hypothetical protein
MLINEFINYWDIEFLKSLLCAKSAALAHNIFFDQICWDISFFGVQSFMAEKKVLGCVA